MISIAIPNHSSQTSNSLKSQDDGHQHTWFTFFLQPSSHLLHPQARINYHTSEGVDERGMRTESISTRDVLAYSGWVIRQSSVNTWWNERLDNLGSRAANPTESDPRIIGWVRVLVHETRGMKHEEDLEKLTWEGSFEVDRQVWHVKTFDSYQRLRGPTDADLSRWQVHPSGGLVAWKDRAAWPTSSSPSKLIIDSPMTLTSQHSAIIAHPFQSPSQLELDRAQTISGTSHLRKRRSIDSTTGGLTSTDLLGTIGLTDGCPSARKVLYIGVAADCNYVSKYGSQDSARLAILNDVNTVSELYERSLNVSLAIVELNIQNLSCPTQASAELPWNVGCPQSGAAGLDLNERLSAFSDWRGKKGGSDGAGLWHLMTACPSGDEVGVAWLGTLCKVTAEDSSSGMLGRSSTGKVTSGTGVTSANPSEWQVMAHEIGHNFGAVHDCSAGCAESQANNCCPFSTSTCVPDNDYIMTATSTQPTSSFSPCSIGNICRSLKSGTDSSCLADLGNHHTISLNQCGNGILDPGEECDPGDTPSACCQWGVCKFAPRAVCDPTHSPCCASDCQFAPSGTVCRPVTDTVCDQAERCTGTKAECPADQYSPNGLACGPSGAGLSCAAGKCTSRDGQCQAQDPKLGLKQACDPSATMDCRIACKDPNQAGQCVIFETKFSEGSPCGCGGFCSATGTCVGSDPTKCGGVGDQWRQVSHDWV